MKKIKLLIVFLLLAANNLCALTVHYNRPDGDYKDWTLWTWGIKTGKSKAVESKGEDKFGVYFVLDMNDYGNTDELGFLPRFKEWERKDDPDRLYDVKMGDDVYILTEDRNVYAKRPDISPRVIKAILDSKKNFRIVLSKSLSEINFKAKDVIFKDDKGKKHNVISVAGKIKEKGKIKVLEAELKDDLSVKTRIDGSVSVPGYRPGPLVAGKILDDPYFYKNIELGAVYSPTVVTFRVFAPTALKVYVNIYEQPAGGSFESKEMKDAGNGVWEAVVQGNLLNKYYKYKTVFLAGEFEGMDPYSKCNTGTNGRCMITKDNTPVAAGPAFAPTDAIVYEVHIRDITIDKNSGVQNRGKYTGLTEYPTYLTDNKKISTALAHMEELGVNVVQLMPFQDFDNDESKDEYNWGYMPLHFNSPDGWFATKTTDSSRVKEAKQMVDAFHKRNIKVVMDIVYNHTAEGNSEVRRSFNAVAPDYYYRVRDDGTYWNGSGCGNEFRSEAPMGRKYILDSLKYWVKEYDLDGFRFDLMGLIDIETMKQVVAELKKIKPDIIIYGEPWGAGNTPNANTTKGTQKRLGFGCFNDNIRDAIKGSEWDVKSKGYMHSGKDIKKVKKGILGSITDFTAEPLETINYIEAHDGYTIWDKTVIAEKSDPSVSEKDEIEMIKLGAAILLTSQGIPFLHAGQDFLRTKNGERNSYNAPDSVNMIDWKRKEKYFDVFEYFKGLISLRKNHPLFRFKTAGEIKENIFFLDDDMEYKLPAQCIAYIINKGKTGDKWENCMVIFNPDSSAVNFEIPKSKWTIATDSSGVYPSPSKTVKDSVEVAPRSAMILYNSDAAFAEKVLKNYKSKKSESTKTLFKISAPGAKKVTVAGTFNGWNMNSHPLSEGKNGMWQTELELEPGNHEYKFLKDGDWDVLNKENRKLTVKSQSKDKGVKPVLFEVSAPSAKKVALAGSFNDWNTKQYYLEKSSGGKWSISLELEPGSYEYKFLQDDDWDILNKKNRTIDVK